MLARGHGAQGLAIGAEGIAMRRRSALLSCLALGLVSGTAAAEDTKPDPPPTYEYVIQPGDTCAGIAERLLGGKRRYQLIHDNNPGMGPTPHRLIPGRVLILPRLDESPDAKLTDVRRAVQTRPPGKPDWTRAKRGKDLYRGWRVNTLERASADVTFKDGALVQMRENTLIIIYGAKSGAARRRTTEATLERGTLRSRLSELRLDVRMPVAEAALEGGSSVVSVDAEGTSRLSNHDGGNARFAVQQGEAVTVEPGFGSKAKRGDRRPTKPVPLPASPSWAVEGPLAFSGARDVGATARGTWSPVEEASHYTIEITRGRDGEDVVLTTIASAEATSFELHRLPEGDYFVRVSAVDDNGFESVPSAPLALLVRLIEVKPPGGTRTAQRTLDLDERASAPPPLRVLPGTALVSPDGYRCAIDGERETDTITLVDPGAKDVVCASEGGDRATALSVTVSAPELEVLEPQPVAPIVRGDEPALFVVATRSELALPSDARFVVPNGIVVEELSSDGNVTRLMLAATQDSPDEFTLQLVSGTEGNEAVLASLPMTTATPDELDFAPNEALGLTLFPDLIGLTNDRREGSGVFLTVGYIGDLPSRNAYWRGTVGVEVAPIRRVRIGLAMPADFAKRGLLPQNRGDQDLLFWGGYRVLMRRDLSVYTELGLWVPLRERAESIARPRFAPAADISYLAVDRLLLRTRQGAILETASRGHFLWASAYGVDIKLVRLFSLSLELDVALGRALGEAATRVGGGPGLSILAGPAAIYLAARFAATDDFERSNGKYNFTGGVRLLF